MLPREERLARHRDFSAVYQRKKSWADSLLVLYVRRYDGREEKSETRRFGFSVSKKVGKAHERNRIKRRLREICRAQRRQLRQGFDAVFVVRSAANTADYAQLENSARELLLRAGLIRRAIGSATSNRGDGSFPPEPNSD